MARVPEVAREKILWAREDFYYNILYNIMGNRLTLKKKGKFLARSVQKVCHP